MVKIKQMQYLSYNANKWLQQSLDLKAMVDSNGAARAVWVAVTTKNTSTRVK
jgi:hypothetical protein